MQNPRRRRCPAAGGDFVGKDLPHELAGIKEGHVGRHCDTVSGEILRRQWATDRANLDRRLLSFGQGERLILEAAAPDHVTGLGAMSDRAGAKEPPRALLGMEGVHPKEGGGEVPLKRVAYVTKHEATGVEFGGSAEDGPARLPVERAHCGRSGHGDGGWCVQFANTSDAGERHNPLENIRRVVGAIPAGQVVDAIGDREPADSRAGDETRRIEAVRYAGVELVIRLHSSLLVVEGEQRPWSGGQGGERRSGLEFQHVAGIFEAVVPAAATLENGDETAVEHARRRAAMERAEGRADVVGQPVVPPGGLADEAAFDERAGQDLERVERVDREQPVAAGKESPVFLDQASACRQVHRQRSRGRPARVVDLDHEQFVGSSAVARVEGDELFALKRERSRVGDPGRRFTPRRQFRRPVDGHTDGPKVFRKFAAKHPPRSVGRHATKQADNAGGGTEDGRVEEMIAGRGRGRE